MPTKRMLTLTALAVLMVPALGAAAPYLPVNVAGPQPEQLVEGHTVFTVIEVNRTTETNGTARFAAAVAVLVREAKSTASNFRFPGVLWFNDQYLVNPESPEDQIRKFRYPCGGAVMAVNRNDPDPRMLLATGSVHTPAGSQEVGQPKPQGTQGAWLNATVDGNDPSQSNVTSDNVASVVVGTAQTGVSYVESYQIMDPNDHNWLIDLYEAYYRFGPLSPDRMTYSYPVWVVNIMGSPSFIPDEGTLDCTPFFDTAVTPLLGQPAANVTKDVSCNHLGGGRAPGGDQGIGMYGVDDPCAGYAEPSRNGYCYGGQDAAGGGCGTSAKPLKLYNAVLFFKLEHLRVAGQQNRTHEPTSTDTNGCHVGTEWTCPEGEDDKEGNSHPFHPHVHEPGDSETGVCVPSGAGQEDDNVNPTDHGGSTAQSTNNGPAPCDYTHATRDIDIYFSPHGRPARPLAPNYVVTDDQGSDAPFHDYGTSYSAAH